MKKLLLTLNVLILFLMVPIYTYAYVSELDNINTSRNFVSVTSADNLCLGNETTPPKIFTLRVSASGNGYANYFGDAVRDNTRSFSVNEGDIATIIFTPDEGCRIKSVKVNNSEVAISNSYTVTATSDTSVEVEFEKTATELVVTASYNLTISATGNGYVSYNDIMVENNTRSISIKEGVSAVVKFHPYEGSKIIKATMNGREISDLSNMSFTIDVMDEDVTIAVEFEKATTYKLILSSTGNGYVSYNNISVENSTRTFSVREGVSAVVKFHPHEGSRIIKATMNGREISDLSRMSFTIDVMDEDVTIAVEFEKAPVINTYSLTLSATGNGSISYNDVFVKKGTRSFSIKEGISAVVKFYPDEGYRIKNATMNGRKINDLSSMSFKIDVMDEDVTIAVEFESIPQYTLTLSAMGFGHVSYDGKSVENNTRSFSIMEGKSAVVNFYPNKGYQIKSATMNGREISNLSNNSFKIDAMDEDVMISVEFEIIKYDLTISSIGSGYVVYNDIRVENNTQNYSIEYGKSVLVILHPNDHSQIKSVTINGKKKDVGLSFTIDVMDEDVTIAVEFEEITHSLTLKATGPGYVSYNDISVEKKTQTFSVVEGTSAIVYFHPNDGGRIKSAKMNGKDIDDLSSMSFKIDVMDEDVTIVVEFEAIPLYTLILSATGYGNVSYNGQSVENSTQSFSVQEGLSAIVKFQPDEGSKIKSAMMNGKDIDDLSSMSFTIDVMDEDVTIEVVFEEMDGWMKVDGVSYEVELFNERKVVVAAGNYGQTLEVPATITYKDETWTVVGLKDGALDKCEKLAAIIWNPTTAFNARVGNPNLLLYVNNKEYASLGVKNVIVNGTAESIELTDVASGNDFHCPKEFKAKNIKYSHYYKMETGLGESKGWETIVLPFNVQKYTSTKGEIVPFAKWTRSGSAKPFWLCELTTNGFKEVEGIKANTPYIISMPNHEQYLSDYVITGVVTFSAEDVEVKASIDMQSARYQDRTFVPNYTNQSNDDYLALNVNNYYVNNTSTFTPDGSKFVKGFRSVHPFEAYMTSTSNTRVIDVMDGMTTAIRSIMIGVEGTDVIKVYDMRGILVKTAKANDDLRMGLKAGVYIVNGKKMIIK